MASLAVSLVSLSERKFRQSIPEPTHVTAVKAGALNVTLTNHRNTDALDGVLGAAGNTLLCPRCVPGLLEILDFPAPFLALLKQ